MQLKCLFWNAGRSSPDKEILDLIRTTGANFVALAEYSGDIRNLLRGLNDSGLDFFLVPIIGCERIHLLTAFEPTYLHHGREADRYTIKELALPGCIRLLICLVHLPSKLHAEDVDQLHTALYFKQDIESAEADAGHDNTIVFGDFNMNPFDDGMVSAAALNSVPCLTLAKKEVRKVGGRNHTFFYNPMWNLLGDFEGPPGTYFHKSPGYLSHYWNLLDQVLLRPSIADRLKKNSLTVITEAGTSSLVSENGGKPKLSDHLPICFSIEIK